MSTSGSTNFTQTRDQISTDTLMLLGVYGQGDTPTTADLSFCSNIMNKMFKAWEGQGIHLWTAVEGALFFTLSKRVYSMSATSVVDIAGDNPIFNVLESAASSSNLTVTSTSGMAVNDKIGVVLDSGVVQWTTIATIPTSTTLTMADGVVSGASVGNSVFSFTNRVDRPLEITSVRYRTGSGVERPLELRSRTDFMNLPNKENTGPANQCFFAPQVSDALFYLWPTADDVNDCVTFSYIRRIQDVDSASDNPDLPQEWLEAITYNLAIRVAPAYGISTQKLNPDISFIAQQSLIEMQMWDADTGSTRIVPNYCWE